MSTIDAVTAWLAAHHAQIMYGLGLLLALLNLLIKVALWAHPLTDWVALGERNPRVASLVRLLNAVGVSPVAVLQAAIDFVRGQASPGTRAFTRSFAVSASRPLLASPAAPVDASGPPRVEMRCRKCGCTWDAAGSTPRRCPICDDPQKCAAA